VEFTGRSLEKKKKKNITSDSFRSQFRCLGELGNELNCRKLNLNQAQSKHKRSQLLFVQTRQNGDESNYSLSFMIMVYIT
jgi:hypothetical protein